MIFKCTCTLLCATIFLITLLGQTLTAGAASTGDGITQRYFILFSDNLEQPYWFQLGFFYDTLIHTYQIPPGNITLLFYDGVSPWDDYPESVINDAASRQTLANAINRVAAKADGDDQVYFYMTGHGLGYNGDPKARDYGTLNSHHVSVDLDDTKDYLEKDFKLITFFANGSYSYRHGMNQLVVDYKVLTNRIRYQRYKIVSTFQNIFFEKLRQKVSNNDFYVEYLYDYLLGDTNRDGYIDYLQGEVEDFDQDGRMPYEPGSGTFDEADWGEWDTYDTLTWGRNLSDELKTSYTFIDLNLDNRLDLAINFDPANPRSDGVDQDNDGLIDGVDINMDGDMQDWVSVDESIDLNPESELLDDELAEMVRQIHSGTMVFILEHCYSGGFLDDLSAPGRVILTAARETESSAQSLDGFVALVTAALRGESRHGEPIDADENKDGQISILEAFNYSAERNKQMGLPQYDDNGDGIGRTSPVILSENEDGRPGSTVFLRDAAPLEESHNFYLPLIQH